MKTFTKTTITEEPRLVIRYDEDPPMSPREWTNLGYFITKDSRYNSPDNHPELLAIIAETGDEANNQAEHIKMIKSAVASRLGDRVVAIYPICKYEHSGVAYHRGTTHGFDYSNNGFYIITEKTLKEIGARNDKKSFERFIDNELEVYNKFVNGEMFYYLLYDEAGKLIDSCGGFFSLDEIKEYLPDEWKDEDMEDYLQNNY